MPKKSGTAGGQQSNLDPRQPAKIEDLHKALKLAAELIAGVDVALNRRNSSEPIDPALEAKTTDAKKPLSTDGHC